MALKVGITGGIGAGKSLISKIFDSFGIPIYNADMEAKKLMNENLPLKDAIRKLFGQNAYKEGYLDRSFIVKKLFNNVENLTRMNELVHPVVINDYNKWLQKQEQKPYSIKEAALLFESGSYKELDKVILVYTPKTIRINRVLMRDRHRTKADIESIIENQMSENKKKKLSDYLIVNDEQKMVIPQVLEIHEKLLKGIG
jgi:dephospho-CoA kinase